MNRSRHRVAARRLLWALTAIWLLTCLGSPRSLSQHPTLLGLTYSGGKHYSGTLISFDAGTSKITTEVDFTPLIGSSPGSSLVRASNGRFYGVAPGGGVNGAGVLFEFDAVTGGYTKKVDFTPPTGAAPRGALIEAGRGLLYGTAFRGGQRDAGVIYQYDIIANRYTKKIDLASVGGDGPVSALVLASNGKLYGTTERGGKIDKGTVFEYDIASNTCTKRHEFDSAGGFYPYGAMIEARPGKLYGGTYAGGLNRGGVIYEFDIATGKYSKKFDFVFPTGRSCFGTLLKTANGKLYGLAVRGGASDLGVLFEFDVETNTYSSRIDLTTATGAHPYGSLMQASDGMIYGMTFIGGASDMGTVFRYDPGTNTYTKLADFDDVTGGKPGYGHFVEVDRTKTR